jgi:CHAT domain-containing protein
MERFYQRFLSGMSAQQALRETQDEFMKSEQWSHPFYWAPFVMVGKG